VSALSQSEGVSLSVSETADALPSQIIQVRKDGSHYVDGPILKHPTLKMTAQVSPGLRGLRVTAYTFAAGPC
jgi:hypothetical protein